MSFPESARLELPILQELEATGGSDQLRYLYDRLAGYFPQLTAEDLGARTAAGRRRWHTVVQRAGRQLIDNGEVRREGSCWSLTARGRRRIEAEAARFVPDEAPRPAPPATHQDAQRMLAEIGEMLGFQAQMEFEHYDVVWRESPRAPRLSHVFEVQVAGSVDSALTRLKHAYDTQRSRPFLVIADERSERFATRRLSGSFHEIWKEVTVIGLGELERLHRALKAHEELMKNLMGRV